MGDVSCCLPSPMRACPTLRGRLGTGVGDVPRANEKGDVRASSPRCASLAVRAAWGYLANRVHACPRRRSPLSSHTGDRPPRRYEELSCPPGSMAQRWRGCPRFVHGDGPRQTEARWAKGGQPLADSVARWSFGIEVPLTTTPSPNAATLHEPAGFVRCGHRVLDAGRRGEACPRPPPRAGGVRYVKTGDHNAPARACGRHDLVM